IPDPDPSNAHGLPIGMTVEMPRDLRDFGPMVGFNCAACHVGRLTRNGRSVRIEGAPNLFDFNAFLLELFQATGDTFRDPTKLTAFRARLPRQDDQAVQRAAQLLVAIRTFLEREHVAELGAGRLRDLLDEIEDKVYRRLQSGGRWTLQE